MSEKKSVSFKVYLGDVFRNIWSFLKFVKKSPFAIGVINFILYSIIGMMGMFIIKYPYGVVWYLFMLLVGFVVFGYGVWLDDMEDC